MRYFRECTSAVQNYDVPDIRNWVAQNIGSTVLKRVTQFEGADEPCISWYASADTLCSYLALGRQVLSLLSAVTCERSLWLGNISTETVSSSEDDECTRTPILSLRLPSGSQALSFPDRKITTKSKHIYVWPRAVCVYVLVSELGLACQWCNQPCVL